MKRLLKSLENLPGIPIPMPPIIPGIPMPPYILSTLERRSGTSKINIPSTIDEQRVLGYSSELCDVSHSPHHAIEHWGGGFIDVHRR